MKKETDYIAEAYQKVLEKKELSADQKKIAQAAEPKDKITGDDFKALKKKKKFDEAFSKACKGLDEIYGEILEENRHINKKFARRYNKVTGALLRAEPGSEEYKTLKAERDDLVSILKDHNMSAADLDAFLIKKEKETPLPEVNNTPNNTGNENSDGVQYSDMEDSNTISVDFSTNSTEQSTATSSQENTPTVAAIGM
jgi:chromosome segregation ATPase